MGLLGARHLAQGSALLVRRTPRARAVGAAVDASHAASMPALARTRCDLRLPALASGTIAGTLALVEIRTGAWSGA
jgi:hypothetical protein